MSNKIANMPNVLSLLRLIISPFLLLTVPLTMPFFILYSLIGLSDAADGFIARRYHLETNLGAKLDSIADIVFFAVFLIIFIPILKFKMWMWIVCGVIILLKTASAVVAFAKFKKVAFLHTVMNKICGFVLFFIPFFLLIIDSDIVIIPIFAVALLAAIEELTINILSKKLDVNIKSLYNFIHHG
ncbi:MAG: CDP-alcohol phosphatidyltransferase family protein [Bacteroidales bacterium]|nr:CDP-alcohol phosphatidyltransferase family protein [Bacteroidales bacterium]